MRLITDMFTFCAANVPQWNTISISGYHIREAGSDAVQEVAFTLADGIAYVEAALDAGLDVDEFAPRLSFFFNVHNNFIEEVAKFRAARTLWARIMQDRFGAKNPKSQMLRFHTPDRGRDAAGAAAARQRRARHDAGARAVLGGTPVAPHQQLRRGARPADRGGRADRAAHAAGDRARVRRRRLHRPARRHLRGRGADRPRSSGASASTSRRSTSSAGWSRAIEQGYPQREIERRAYEHQRAVETQGAHRRRRQRVRDGRRGAGAGRDGRPGARARPGRARRRRCARGATPPRPRARSQALDDAAAGHRQPRRADRRRGEGARRPSARSPTCCARGSASTSPRADRPARHAQIGDDGWSTASTAGAASTASASASSACSSTRASAASSTAGTAGISSRTS